MTPTQCQSDDFQREDSLPVSDVRCTEFLDRRGGSVEGEIQALPSSAKQQGLTRQLGGGARGSWKDFLYTPVEGLVQSGGMKTIYDEGDDVFPPDALLARINVAYGLRVWRLVSKQARTDPARSALSKLPSCVFVGKACVTGPARKRRSID